MIDYSVGKRIDFQYTTFILPAAQHFLLYYICSHNFFLCSGDRGKPMISELRRARRHVEFLPIRVTVLHGPSGKVKAGPFSTRIINFSQTGVCLFMSQVMRDRFHIFYSTREDNSLILQLAINIQPDFHFKISAVPIWLNRFKQGEIRAFKMGVDFLTNPEGEQIKKLQAAMAGKQKKRGEWWTAHTLRAARMFSVFLFSGR
jgi:hypothetical protein